MEKIIERLASYHLFNYIFPGFLVLFCYYHLNGLNGTDYNIMALAAPVYFCGLFVSRIGSLVVEPLLKKTNFIKFATTEKYINATKRDAKIETLMETANMYRSLIVASLLVIVMILFTKGEPVLIMAGAISLVVFLFSYKKQIGYVTARVEKVKNVKK